MPNEDETRLRAVEEAVIEFRNIAKIVIVDLKERVRTLEDHDKAFTDILHNSCEIKTKEIDDKTKLVKNDVYKDMRESRGFLIKLIVTSFLVSASLFGLFVGGLAHFNSELSDLGREVNRVETKCAKSETANSTDIKSVLRELKYIRSNMDMIHKHP